MYKQRQANKTTIKVNKAFVGETIEGKVRRMASNKEPIKDAAPLIYTERKDGVRPEYDIRTDKLEYALESMTLIANANEAKRKLGKEAAENMEKEKGTEVKVEVKNSDSGLSGATGGQQS